jgi:hypothetical protein
MLTGGTAVTVSHTLFALCTCMNSSLSSAAWIFLSVTPLVFCFEIHIY